MSKPTEDEAIRAILDAVQEQTIVVDIQGSVLGPKEDARAFEQIKVTAHKKLSQLLRDAKLGEHKLFQARLYKPNSGVGTVEDWSNHRIAELTPPKEVNE